MVEFLKTTQSARAFTELESTVHSSLGKTGLMTFMKLDHGAILRKDTGLDTQNDKACSQCWIYAPVTILVDERPDGVHLSYDKMAILLAPYGNSYALTIARDLDSKIENLLRESAL